MAGDKRNKRPFEEPSEKIYLNLKIKSQDGTFMYFRVKPTSMMKPLFESYSERKQIINYKAVRFLYDGKRISPRNTVNQDDTILHFRVNPSTVMGDIRVIVFRFFIDGKRLSSKKTVNEVRLKDGDEIHAMLHQDGGGPTRNH
ncbi:small ubiquitin-related modifier 2-like [Solanum dulcamara]|uniref:small ubiquitin-related modifier 2-like n=1 Tax=Solanum dulcamara TaxID=45834 RepID=UPI002486922E|nr:small ubiquitin-related modifier 2-like [Solanum dulcamara]